MIFFLAVYLSVVSGLVLGGATSFVGALTSVLIAVGYMLLFFVIARKATPFLNKILDISSNEIFIIVIFAILFFVAGFSETIHVAEAIGALLLGLVFSETEHSDRIEKLVVPFRDFFGAIFFFQLRFKHRSVFAWRSSVVGIRSSFHYSNRQFYCWNDGGT